jgi:hypothetical protein
MVIDISRTDARLINGMLTEVVELRRRTGEVFEANRQVLRFR